MKNKKKIFAYLYGDKVDREEDYKHLDVINYSFGKIEAGKLSLKERPQIDFLVKTSHKHNVKVVLAIGGWGAGGFSEAAMTKATRKILIDSILDAVKTYDLDGIDYDWEYPTTGVANIAFDLADLNNFTLLVKETKEALDSYKKGLILSSAFAGSVFAINKYYEVSKLNEYLDYFHIMTYDIETRGKASHHTSLYLSKGATSSVDSSVRAFIKAGADPAKIIIGGAFYGKKFKLETKYNPLGEDAVFTGTSTYDVITSNFIDKNPEYVFYDDEAKANYYYDGEVFITYDSEDSLIEKTKYVNNNNLGGVMFWSLTGDTSGRLLEAIWKTISN